MLLSILYLMSVSSVSFAASTTPVSTSTVASTPSPKNVTDEIPLVTTVPEGKYRLAVVQYVPVTESDPGVKSLKDAVRRNVANYEQFVYEAKSKFTIVYYREKKNETNNVMLIVFPEYGLTVLPDFASKNFSARSRTYVYKEGQEQGASSEKAREREAKQSYKAIEKIRASLATVASEIPAPEDNVAPCDDNGTVYSESLRNMSCIARRHELYVAVNHIERAKCEPQQCTRYTDGFLLHNTNVVFDRNGTVVARYRKYYVHNEPWLDKIPTPELSVFTTDFNVTFAQLIGVDILRTGTTRSFYNFDNLTDIIYPTHSWDDMWLLNTKHDLRHWAAEFNANLLVAGWTKDGGSEMINGQDGPVRIYMRNLPDSFYQRTDFALRRLRKDCIEYKPFSFALVGEFSLKVNASSSPPQKSIWLTNDGTSFVDLFNEGHLESRLLELKSVSRSDNLCVKDFCCYFEYHTTFNEAQYNFNNSIHFRHRIVAFRMFSEFYDKSMVSMEVCALISCTSDRLEDCGKKIHPGVNVTVTEPLMMNTMLISRYMVPDVNLFVAPLATRWSQNRGMHLDERFSFMKTGSHYSNLYVMSIGEPNSDIMFFGINARNFDVTNVWDSIKPSARECDVKGDSHGSAAGWLFGMMILIAVAVGLAWYNRGWIRQNLFRRPTFAYFLMNSR